MSIDVKTLHIGSHISVDGKRAKVVGIRTTSAMSGLPIVQYTTESVVRFGELLSDSAGVMPIPLTSELLEELGFEWKDKGCWQHCWKGGFDLTRRGKSSYWDYEGDISVQYLHELESLYYLVYEKELIKE